MPLDFPSNPTNGQVYDTYVYDSSIASWRSQGSTNNLGVQIAALQLADDTTNKSGLVPILPTSVTLGSGTSSTAANGVVTFSAASAVTLNGVFSSSYRTYLVRYESLNSATDALLLRLATTASGANSSSLYSEQFHTGVDTTTTASRNSSLARFSLSYSGAQRYNVGEFVIHKPAESAWTTTYARNLGATSDVSSSTIANINVSGVFAGTNQFDGIAFLPNGASTNSGTVQVFGIR